PGAGAQHRGESVKDLAHLRRLVWKQLRRIHVVHDGGIVRLKDQQVATLVLRAIDCEIVETDPLRHTTKRGRMAVRKSDVERTHERFFFETLGCAVGHSRVEIPDIPLTGDRHVAGVRPAFDKDYAVLAEQAILARIVDEARNKEFRLRPCFEISADRGSIIEHGEANARMRTAWPDDGRKLQLGSELAPRKIRRRNLG